ncbi:hemerythrin domain-containing protein [Streptomyces gobiensis]|uniref:hemerythrin domain-containing protein n=1 Tax=Streptomyces gobiensis TaxID=2875706 RepID=UPI001E518092|nr:hemerythrin domain-containing protein [Streptomyces gobiensis]UGY91608.1 hemerythrin domain-containing protein [Streptomyces gobiensis]
MADNGSVIDELTNDHREVEEIFGRINACGPGDPMRKTYSEQATIELVRHSVAEEEYLYPAVREHVPQGDSLADKEIKDHAEAEKLMKKLEGLEADNPEFDQTLGKLMQEIRSHVEDEENNLFPKLRDAVTPQMLNELGAKVRQAKKMAPTRPHPSAPDQPPANKLLAPGAGLVDRARDMVSGRGRKD